jgi:hypothetical protein
VNLADDGAFRDFVSGMLGNNPRDFGHSFPGFEELAKRGLTEFGDPDSWGFISSRGRAATTIGKTSESAECLPRPSFPASASGNSLTLLFAVSPNEAHLEDGPG